MSGGMSEFLYAALNFPAFGLSLQQATGEIFDIATKRIPVTVDASALNINLSDFLEYALIVEVRRKSSPAQREEAEREWKEENAEAIAYANAYFEEHGLPFAHLRRR